MCSIVFASPPTLTSFQSGHTANASEVNDNFLKLRIYAESIATSLTPNVCSGSNQGLQWSGATWVCTTFSFTPSTLSCPPGYIPVPGNSTLGTAEFCIAKFEMKNDGAGNPVSKSKGTPWGSINANNAYSECASITASTGGEFALISNPEWMTIARNIEAVDSNWSGGSVGSGMLPRGNSDASSVASAVSDTSDSYSDTGNSASDAVGSGWEQKRVHTLSNGAEIWDFAGNVWEYVDFSTNDSSLTTGPTDCPSSYNEFNTGIPGGCSLQANDFQPSTTSYTSSQGVGVWYGGTGGAAIRGQATGAGSKAGIYTILLGNIASDGSPSSNRGFRCVFRP